MDDATLLRLLQQVDPQAVRVPPGFRQFAALICAEKDRKLQVALANEAATHEANKRLAAELVAAYKRISEADASASEKVEMIGALGMKAVAQKERIAELEADLAAVAQDEPVAWEWDTPVNGGKWRGNLGYQAPTTGVGYKNLKPLFYGRPQAAPGWQPIETAPEGLPVVVAWLDADDTENPERYDFDYKEDGGWVKHEELYQEFCAVAPPGSRGPSAEAPYTYWMPLSAIPAAPTPEPQS